MAVYQPSAIIGNSRVLITLGARGELMTFFYPHLDHAQNLREGMPAVYFLDGPDGGHLAWTFAPEWTGHQRYLEDSNIVETRLYHAGAELELTITDLVHPTEPVLRRRYEAVNRGARTQRGKLFQYLGLQLGESLQKNAAHFHPHHHLGVAYWRDICFALGGELLDEHGCGRMGTPTSTKLQMERGRLNRQEDEIGTVDVALGWGLSLAPGETVVRTLTVAADEDELAAVARLEAARAQSWEESVETVRAQGAQHLARARPLQVAPDLEAGYRRCLLALDLLADSRGSVLAAPEFDPAYERSGGYGYCWPRDAVEVGLGLEAAGYPEYLQRFLEWAMGCQRLEGYWEQRYWLGGERAPSWCTHEDRLQIDQTAAVLFALGRGVESLAPPEREEYGLRVWPSVRAAADYLVRSLSPVTNLHLPAFDLWETFRGSFTYSNAAISCALEGAAVLAREAGDETRTAQYEERASAVRQAVMERLWQGDYFARGMDLEGRVDTTADASILGLITPFPFLRLDRPEERARAAALIDALGRRLGRVVAGGELLLRFEGDSYAGGGPGITPTLWLVRALLALAARDRDAAGVEACRSRAIASLRAVLSLGTPTGMLPEMVGPGPGELWAVPHAWSMASLVEAVVRLDELS